MLDFLIYPSLSSLCEEAGKPFLVDAWPASIFDEIPNQAVSRRLIGWDHRKGGIDSASSNYRAVEAVLIVGCYDEDEAVFFSKLLQLLQLWKHAWNQEGGDEYFLWKGNQTCFGEGVRKLSGREVFRAELASEGRRQVFQLGVIANRKFIKTGGKRPVFLQVATGRSSGRP